MYGLIVVVNINSINVNSVHGPKVPSQKLAYYVLMHCDLSDVPLYICMPKALVKVRKKGVTVVFKSRSCISLLLCCKARTSSLDIFVECNNIDINVEPLTVMVYCDFA